MIKNSVSAVFRNLPNSANPHADVKQKPADGVGNSRFLGVRWPLWSAALMGGLAIPAKLGATTGSVAAAPENFVMQHAADIKRLVDHLWPDAKNVRTQHERIGVSPFFSDSLVVDGTKFHIKMARSPLVFDAQDFAEEVRYATWASTQALAPKVIYKDVSKGILVTEFAEDAIPDWNDGAQEPKLSAMVNFMAAMNLADMEKLDKQIDTAALLYNVENLITRALNDDSLSCTLRQRFNLLQHNIRLIGKTLQGRSFMPARIHGDFHQNNFLYQPHGSVMVDWGRTKLGDPMQELASLCYFTDRGILELPNLVSIYGPGLNSSVARAQVYIAVQHATLFAEEYLGLEPQRALSSDEKMDYLWAFLQEDFAFYELVEKSQDDKSIP